MTSWLPLAVLLLLVARASPAAATSYTVGDGSGWTTGVDYATWAASKNFKDGDNLGTFIYSQHRSKGRTSRHACRHAFCDLKDMAHDIVCLLDRSQFSTTRKVCTRWWR
jgi:hypothetical protein